MKSRLVLMIAAFSASVFLASSASAQDQCAAKLTQIANAICGEVVSMRGSTSSKNLGGSVEAKVDSWLGRLVSLGSTLNAGTSKQEYENILREDLPQVLKQGGECRLEAVKLFYEQTCAAPVAKSNSSNPFNLVAVMAGYPKLANVFSGPGVQYPIAIELSNPQLQFRTYRQVGDFWLVQMPRGRTGYMHTSRIRLLP